MNRIAILIALSIITVVAVACGTSESPSEQAKLAAPPAPELGASAPPTATAEPMKGLFVYMADAASFTDCTSGDSFPVAMEGDYFALERAYLDHRSKAGADLMVSFEGSVDERPAMEGGGVEATVVVDRFLETHPGQRCADVSHASFDNTFWALVQVGDRSVTVGDDQREPHLLFNADTNTFKGFAGCNQIFGSIETEGNELAFGPVAATKRYCQEAMELEQAVMGMLNAVTDFTIDGDVILLRDGERVLARGEARYFD
jgi:heat shock protein HslJ